MFRLMKILGGRQNVSEARTVMLASALTKPLYAGTPFALVDGVPAPLDDTAANCACIAKYVALADAKIGDTSLVLTDLLPGMVFETLLTDATTPANLEVGNELRIYNHLAAETLTLTSTGGDTFAVGDFAHLEGGVMRKVNATTRATHVCTTAVETAIASSTSSAAFSPIVCGGGVGSAKITAGTHRGAVLFDAAGAAGVGDRVLVTLPIA